MLKLTEDERKELIERTVEYLELRRLTTGTIEGYKYCLKRFFDNCNYNGKLEKFDDDDLLDYIKCFFLNKDYHANTYNRHIASIKTMFLVNYKKTFLKTYIPTAKVRKKLPIPIEKDDFKMIFDICDLRTKCFLLLGYMCGLRASETATIRIENINSKNKMLKIIGKGEKERYVQLPDIVTYYLRMFYLTAKIKKKEGYLFAGYKNDHINSENVSRKFTEYKKMFNFNKNYSYHSLRHAYATNYIINGGNILKLQMLLGHTDISTTEIYLHLVDNTTEGVFEYEQ